MTHCPLIDDECRDDCEWAVPISDPDIGGKEYAVRNITQEMNLLSETLNDMYLEG